MAEQHLMSIEQAVAWGIERLRRPIWADEMDHLKVDIIEGRMGPWAHLFCPFNLRCNGKDPVAISTIMELSTTTAEYVPYYGPLPDSDEYRARQAAFGREDENG